MQKLFENWREYVNESNDNVKILIFGHSQSHHTSIGGAQKQSLISQGVSRKQIVMGTFTGKNDRGLAQKIKKIS